VAIARQNESAAPSPNVIAIYERLPPPARASVIVLASRRAEIYDVNGVFSRGAAPLGKLERIQTKRFRALCDN